MVKDEELLSALKILNKNFKKKLFYYTVFRIIQQILTQLILNILIN